MMYKSVLVTGGSGFLGSYIIESLKSSSDAEVYFTARKLTQGNEAATALNIDITNRAHFTKYKKELEHIECLVHAAATVTHAHYNTIGDEVDAYIGQSLNGFANLIDHLPNLKKIIYISSGSAQIAKEDSTFYGLSKLIMEQAVEHYGTRYKIPYISLRFPQLYGPGEPHGTFVSTFIDKVSNNQSIQLINEGTLIRDILYVKEAARSVVYAIDSSESGTFSIADPDRHTVSEVLKCIIGILNPSYDKIEHLAVATKSATVNLEIHSDLEKFGYILMYNLSEGLKETIESRRS